MRRFITITLLLAHYGCSNGNEPLVPFAGDKMGAVGSGNALPNAPIATQASPTVTIPVTPGPTSPTSNEETVYSGSQSPSPAPAPTSGPVVESTVSTFVATLASLSLSCKTVGTSIHCDLLGVDGRASTTVPSAAYLKQGRTGSWAKTSFSADSMGGYTIAGSPAAGVGYQVALRYGSNSVAIDVVDATYNYFANIVRDASFEFANTANDKKYVLLNASQINAWKLRLPATSRCSLASLQLEVQSIRTAAEGDNYVELDGRCADEANTSQGSVGLNQDIDLIAGHLYHLSFAYARRDTAAAQQLKVQWGSEVVFDKAITEVPWQVGKIVKGARVGPGLGAQSHGESRC
ncbi:MAG: hypothetical protein EOO38_07155 [Cytophagaceae bacterium]|nr:MAG: hypothetical protein EOO38_07155 [Cytophagaceae bacterium]